MTTADSGAAVSSRCFTSPRKDMRRSGTTVAAAYLFNPFTILTCLARPTSVFTHTLILEATARAASGATITCLLALALASYLSLYPLLLLPPLLMLCHDSQGSRTEAGPHSPAPRSKTPSGKDGTDPRDTGAVNFAVTYTGVFATALAVLLLFSRAFTGSWNFLFTHYLHMLLMPTLTPNVGLWWYFFTEMFDSFREFFLAVFWLHVLAYMPALCIRLRRQPLFVVCAILGVVSIYAPYPAAGDAGLFLSVLGLFRHTFPCRCIPRNPKASSY